MTKRLNEGPWFARSGRHPWSLSVLHSILCNPIHAGTTCANRYRYVAPEKPKKGRGPRSGENTCRKQRLTSAGGSPPGERRLPSRRSRPSCNY
jgi:hypothetical protein